MSYLGKSNLTSKHNHFQFTAVPRKRLSSYTEERVDLSLSGEPILILRSLEESGGALGWLLYEEWAVWSRAEDLECSLTEVAGVCFLPQWLSVTPSEHCICLR